jgi:hypothetical protein
MSKDVTRGLGCDGWVTGSMSRHTERNDISRFGSSHLLHPVVCCANSPVFGKKFRAPQDLRRRGLGQTHENRKDV